MSSSSRPRPTRTEAGTWEHGRLARLRPTGAIADDGTWERGRLARLRPTGPAAESTTLWQSPIGLLEIRASASGLTAVEFAGVSWAQAPQASSFTATDRRPPLLNQTIAELTQYFAGERRIFTIPLDLRGTPFQRAVWEQLLALPYGATTTYRELARAAGRPSAIRAAGAANGVNPIAVIVPCHRVIGANGSLTGYGGGLPLKRYLLDLESAVSHGSP